jgi:predicted nucleic acid-binding protein
VNAAFADTSFFLALLRADDPVHERAERELASNRPLLTTEFILLELGNACARAVDHEDFLTLVAGLRASPRATITALDSRLLDRGLELMRVRPDKDWSLTDCISFVVMQDRGLHDALTADHNFEQAGFKAVLR